MKSERKYEPRLHPFNTVYIYIWYGVVVPNSVYYLNIYKLRNTKIGLQYKILIVLQGPIMVMWCVCVTDMWIIYWGQLLEHFILPRTPLGPFRRARLPKVFFTTMLCWKFQSLHMGFCVPAGSDTWVLWCGSSCQGSIWASPKTRSEERKVFLDLMTF